MSQAGQAQTRRQREDPGAAQRRGDCVQAPVRGAEAGTTVDLVSGTAALRFVRRMSLLSGDHAEGFRDEIL